MRGADGDGGMRLLLVEDNRRLSEWLRRLLAGRNYTTDCVYDGEEADAVLLAYRYDLIVLDLALPELEGLDVLKRLRSRGDPTPVLILSASDDLVHRVAGLDLGADDYLSKPFEAEELEARIRALLRRGRGQSATSLRFGRLSFDATSRTFTADDQALALTPRERAVLEKLILRPRCIVSKENLAESVFGFNEDASTSSIEIYIHRIRKKIIGFGVEIATLRGIGYMLREYSGGKT